MKNSLIILSGPSGVGKGTIIDGLLEKGGFALSISCTTRAPREGEEDGKAYFFITKEEFEKRLEKNGFLEYNEHFNNYYGTPRDFVVEKLKKENVILEIEVDGALKVKESYSDALLIMVLPPSREELRARLIKRGTESEEQIEARLARMDYEISKKDKYDFVVINDNLEKTVEEIENIIDARNKV